MYKTIIVPSTIKYLNTLCYPETFSEGFAWLNPKKTKLPVSIRCEYNGILNKNNLFGQPIIELTLDEDTKMLVILSTGSVISYKGDVHKHKEKFDLGYDYVKRNEDLFLRHFLLECDHFDDEDLFDSLKKRGEYK